MSEISYTTRNFIKTNIGDLPILITCPHNGNDCPASLPDRQKSNYPQVCKRQGNFTVKSDNLTNPITDGIAEKIIQLTK